MCWSKGVLQNEQDKGVLLYCLCKFFQVPDLNVHSSYFVFEHFIIIIFFYFFFLHNVSLCV